MTSRPVTNPATKPPDDGKPYFAVIGEDGMQQWLLAVTDDDIGAADVDFEPARRWARAQADTDGR